MATIPTTEPSTITAGDSITWIRTIADYPADVWTLKYRLINATGKIDIAASADGTNHLISVAPAISASYLEGAYSWTAWVEKTGERFTIASGSITVKPDPAATNILDTRSDAAKIVDQLMAAYISYTSSSGHIAEYNINGRAMKYRSATEILEQINHWKAQLAAEQRAQRIAAGLGAGNNIRVRF